MYLIRKNGQASNVIRRVLRHSSTGQGLTGLSSSSTGLIISTICDNEAAATAYTSASSNIETITTLGTFAAPTGGKCRFKEVDATNHPGLYEFQFADARFAVAGAKTLRITVSGATNLLQQEILVQLTAFDLDSSAPNVNAAQLGGVAQTGRDIGASVLLSSGTGTGQVQLSGGVVRANDSSGSAVAPAATALSTAQWTNARAAKLDSLDAAVSSRLAPTVAGRTLDVTANGCAGIDWGNLENPTASVSLSGTTVDTVGTVGAVSSEIDANVTSVAGQSGLATTGGIVADVALWRGAQPNALQSGRVDASVGANNDKSGYALTSAYDFATGTTAVAESYAANGTAPTPVQALLAIHQMLMGFTISGTTYTVKKLDGSTTAFVVTLDDATNPTGATRA